MGRSMKINETVAASLVTPMPRIAAKYSKSWSEASAAHCSKNRSPMSALGQKQTFG
jgi:hypothetical protein